MSLKFTEDYFKFFNFEKFKNTLEGLDFIYDFDVDINKICEDHKNDTPAELRSYLENLDTHLPIEARKAEESLLADVRPITGADNIQIVTPRKIEFPTSAINDNARFKETLSDINYFNEIGTLSGYIDKLTNNYFTNTRVLVSELINKCQSFFYNPYIYGKKFLVHFDSFIYDALAVCVKYDNNDNVNSTKVLAVIKDIITKYIDDVSHTLFRELGVTPIMCREIIKDFTFDKFKLAMYYHIDVCSAGYNTFYTDLHFQASKVTDEQLNEIYDYIYGINKYEKCQATESTKASDMNTKAGSKVMKDLKDGGYAAYKIYKKHEQNYDNQATKLAGWAKKIAFGDKREEIIEGKKWSVIGITKKILGSVALFSINPVVGVLGTVTAYATDKKLTHKERMQILTELENEKRMLQEKIDDAKAAGDNKAKYALMRADNELTEAISKIRTAAQRSQNVKNSVRTVVSRGSGTGA